MHFGHPTEDFLTSLGFRFGPPGAIAGLPDGFTYSKLLERHHRLKCRELVGETAFGPILEGVVSQLLLGTFKYDAINNVRIEDEGSGGDYDVLAFAAPHLLYVECKSGRTLGFKNTLDRHDFLRPALTLILHDVTKQTLEEQSVKEVQRELTERARAADPNVAKMPAYAYPMHRVSDPERSYALYNTRRNLFIASGEDLEHAVRMTLRHFHQVVQQTSYWS
jgi:hypothetical protein